MIRDAHPADGSSIAEIYNDYILDTIITFEETPVTSEEMEGRVRSISQQFPYIVFEEKGSLLGYAYAGSFRSRVAYRHTVESTVYLHRDYLGRGIGTALYEALLERLRKTDCHRVIGGISLPNPQSVALHEKLNFKKVAHFSECGRKFDRWIDVGFWELKL